MDLMNLKRALQIIERAHDGIFPPASEMSEALLDSLYSDLMEADIAISEFAADRRIEILAERDRRTRGASHV